MTVMLLLAEIIPTAETATHPIPLWWTAVQVVSAILLIGGGLFSFIGGIGIVRFPDFYSRIHGAGMADTAGAFLMLVGLMLISSSWLVAIKLGMILFFMFVACPASSHALAKAALYWGIDPELERGDTLYTDNLPRRTPDQT